MSTISNIVINQGADYSTTVTVSDGSSAVNLVGYTATAQIRKSFDSTTAVDMTCTFADDRTSGQITLSLTDSQTSAMEWGRYVWDLLISTAGGNKTRVVEGIATVSPSVTRS
jgi:hypothetical protein